MGNKLKILVLVLLAATFLLPFFSAQNFSAASDEITHLPSGYSYWKTGLVELNPQHPPLVKLMAGLPLLFMQLKFNPRDPSLVGPLKNEWQFGWNLLFGNQADKLLFWGRLPIMLLSLLLGWYVFKWASEMFVPVPDVAPPRVERLFQNSSSGKNYLAGLLSLFIYAFMPVIIANAQFVTTDLPVTALSFIALYYLWKFFKTNWRRYLIFSGLFLGLALGSKFSAVLLLPIMAVLILVHLWSKRPDPEVELAFGKQFRGTDAQRVSVQSRHRDGWETKTTQALKLFSAVLGLSFGVIYLIYLMPLDLSFYLKGLKTVYADWDSSYKFYLNGNFSTGGWWYYFPAAFLMKTPLPALLAFGLAAVMYKKYKISFQDKAFIFVPLVVFLLMTMWKAGNISLRYLLPVYPFLILYAGGLTETVSLKWGTLKDKIILTGAGILAVWYLFSALHIYPDYLAYFNELAGGPANGYKHLDDSNLEWGQDLKRLATYQKQYPEMKILYSWDYSNPDYYGVKNVLPKKPESFLNPSGRYAVNVHYLVRLQELSQRFNNKGLNWLSLYKPVDKIGYSFFVYQF